ncbi:hypothetical protein IHE55_11735 [Streptomyces pactum]|uniref:Lipoprotein n=1 Tax=Streptomyces pactum TaxID=68249 RepID=A0ABS0NJU2_9ACTN|nr:hypothetical protein [Streptomyces pactum]MBH5335433.1 hypothetical protein [Streptomyces pactum]
MRTARLGIRAAALAGGIVMAVGLTACGSDKEGDDKPADKAKDSTNSSDVAPRGALAALKLASQRTDEQDSAKVEGSTVIGEARTTMSGEMDWSTGGIRARMDVTQSGGAVQGSPMDGKAMPALYTADAMYMNLGDQFAATPQASGAHWVKYDYDVLAQKAGPAGAFLKDTMQNNNPARSVQLVLATGEVKAVGEETVKGVKATRYSGTVKVADLAKLQSKDLTAEELSSLQKQLEQSGTKTETIDLWIDENNLLVKKREYGENNNGKFDSTVFYTDYGVDVSVEEPPASDTVNFEEIQG